MKRGFQLPWRTILGLCIVFQAVLIYYYYEVRGHRLAGIDFLSYYYPASSTLLVQYGALSSTLADLHLNDLMSWTQFHFAREPQLLDSYYLPFYPFVFFYAKPALWAFLVVNLVLPPICAAFLCRRLNLVPALAVAAATVLSAPVFHNLLHGHASGIFLAILCAALLLESKKTMVAGALMALFIVHNIYYFPILFLFLASRKYAFCLATAFVMIALSFFGHDYFMSFGGLFKIFKYYAQHTQTVGDPVIIYQAGLREFLYRFFHGGDHVIPFYHCPMLAHLSYFFLSFGVWASTAWFLWKGDREKTKSPILEWGLLLSALCLTVPSMGNYNLVYMLFPVLILGRYIQGRHSEGMGCSRQFLTSYFIAAFFVAANFGPLRYPDFCGGILLTFPNPELIGMAVIWLMFIRIFYQSVNDFEINSVNHQ